jgi:uncharacterized membrane protein
MLFFTSSSLMWLHVLCLQIAPVVDASSSQSRADVLGIFLSAVLLLTGLQWLSLKAKPVEAVSLSCLICDAISVHTCVLFFVYTVQK